MPIFTNEKSQPIEKPADKLVDWRVCAYALILDSDNKVFVVNSDYSDEKVWEIPGGGVEIHESLEEGLKRECREEIGYNVELFSQVPFYIGEQYYYRTRSEQFFHAVLHFYQATLSSKAENVQHTDETSTEILKRDWVPLSDLTEANCHHMLWPAIQKFRKSK